MQEELRVALLGAGEIAATAHAPAWRGREDARIICVVDPDQSRAERLASDLDARSVPNLAGALAADDVDAVDICTPPHLHADLVRQALTAGVHVLVEKPLATTISEAHQLVALQRRHDATVMVAENWLYSSARQDAESAIREHNLGTPFLVKAWHQSALYIASEGLVPEWTFSDRAQGGYMMQAGVHTLSLLHAMVGPVAEVFAYSDAHSTNPAALPLDRTDVLSLRFQQGTLGSVVLTGRSRHAGPRRLGFEVFFEDAVVEFDVWSGEVALTRAGERTIKTRETVSLGFDEEIDHFVNCIRSRSEPETSPRRLLPALNLVFAAYQAAHLGAPVRPDQLTVPKEAHR